MKHMKKMLALALAVMSVLAIAVPATALDGGYEAAAVYLGTTTLQRGNVSTAVANLQRMLASCGYSVGPIDGIFGSLTEQTVKDVQEYGASVKKRLQFQGSERCIKRLCRAIPAGIAR